MVGAFGVLVTVFFGVLVLDFCVDVELLGLLVLGLLLLVIGFEGFIVLVPGLILEGFGELTFGVETLGMLALGVETLGVETLTLGLAIGAANDSVAIIGTDNPPTNNPKAILLLKLLFIFINIFLPFTYLYNHLKTYH